MKQRKPKNPSKRPRPSYEDGELRDKSIEKLQDPGYQKSDFVKLVGKVASSRRKPPNDR